MTSPRKIVVGGLVLALCGSSLGCAGSPLRNMLSWNPTRDYKSLDELDAEKGEADAAESRVAQTADEKPTFGQRFASWTSFGKDAPAGAETESASEVADARDTDRSKVAGTSVADANVESPESKDRPFPFSGRSRKVTSDPFLTADEQNSHELPGDSVAGKSGRASKTTSSGLNSEGTESSGAKDKAERGRFASLPAEGDVIESSIRRTSAQTEQLFADWNPDSVVPSSSDAALQETEDDETAEPLITPSTRGRVAAESTGTVDDLEALLAKENPFASAATNLTDEQAVFGHQPRYETRQTSRKAESGVAGKSETMANAFDSLLAAGTQTAAASNSAAGTISTAANDRVGRVGQTAVSASTQAFDALFGNAAAAAGEARDSINQAAESDPLLAAGVTVAQSLTADSGFAWKDASAGSVVSHKPTASSGREPTDATAPLPPLFDNSDRVTGVDRVTGQRVAGADTVGGGSESSRSPLTIPPVHAASTSRVVGSDAGFASADPFFDDELPTAAAPTVAKAHSTPTFSVFGALTSLSLRTVGLIFGCIIVAILLFAPGRKKSVSTGR